ncbi:MAG: transaldolase, partial [Elusimicrobia bacterium]|nr:transaldolase [Elusimicrobiota bacterium]
KTLFIVSSKSGSTLEPNCLMDYFWAGVEEKEGAAAGRRFVAITDPGTSLEELARRRRFRKVFLNPADVGGRFCALTFFGLVPAALMGVDVERLLSRSREMARRCGQGAADGDNPALRLGAALGGHAAAGRDQLTLWLSPAIASFGLWVEQLLAESTGKEGRGILPVLGEPILEPGAYGAKRLLASVALACQPAPSALARLESRERPRLSLSLADAYDLGGQFFLWEAATAAAGLLLGVNPFDQPDVQSAKDQAKALLSSLQAGELPAEPASLDAGGLAGFADEGLLSALGAKAGAGPARRTLADVLSAHFSRLRRDGYAAVLAYVQPTDEHRRALEALAERLRALSGAPICLEFGPRYLHSTGQLYKGGGPGGVFLQLIESGGPRLPVPGRDFTFDTLHLAQGRGDFAALLGRGRPVLRLELGDPGRKPLQALLNAASALECRR